MTNIKTDPLLRTLIGFGDLFSNAMAGAEGFPPFDIESTGKGAVRVSVAAAGFSPDELTVDLMRHVPEKPEPQKIEIARKG